jgi:PAS domain S-box-containing protein
LWPAIAVSTWLASLAIGDPLPVALAVAAGHTLATLCGAAAMERSLGASGSIARLRDVVVLAVLAGAASTTIDASVGMLGFTLTGRVPGGGLTRCWIAWWTSDVVGVLIVAPFVLCWTRASRARARPRLARRERLAPRVAEAVALGASLVALSLLVLSPPSVLPRSALYTPYLLLFPLGWAAVRFGVRGAATANAVVGTLAVWSILAQRGPFVQDKSTLGLDALHLFLASISTTGLALAALISERERSLEALSASEASMRAAEQSLRWLAAIVESSEDAIVGRRLDGTIVSWNNGAERLFGYTAQEAIGQSALLDLPAEQLALLRVGKKVEGYETVKHRKDGREIEVSVSASAVRDAGVAIIGASAIFRDLTELSQLHHLAVDAAGIGMWFRNLESDRLTWTPQNRRHFGLSPDEEVSIARWRKAVHPDDLPRVEEAVQRAIRERSLYHMEYRVVWPDGTVHWVSSRGRVTTEQAGAPARVIGVVTDVTARREAEQQRAELLERERDARAEAQAATAAKDEFLAVVSHELRTPLQSMLGWTKVLEARSHDDPTLEKGLASIERNAKTQSRLIEDLLDVSRIVTGKLRLSVARVDLGPIVAAAVDSVRAAAADREVRIEARLPAIPCAVMGDPERLQQIVGNLVSNAVKFTPAKGRVDVELMRASDSARIVVADTGCGITPEFLPHVFESFRQAEGATTQRRGGLGLGLSIVRHLAEAHHGSVKAESAGEGLGATFTVTLPTYDPSTTVASLPGRAA